MSAHFAELGSRAFLSILTKSGYTFEQARDLLYEANRTGALKITSTYTVVGGTQTIYGFLAETFMSGDLDQIEKSWQERHDLSEYMLDIIHAVQLITEADALV